MTSDEKDELVCLPFDSFCGDACKKYYELFKKQVASGGGNHVIVTPYWPEFASQFITCVILTLHTKWQREKDNSSGSSNEYIVVIEPTEKAARESAHEFSIQMSRKTCGKSQLEFDDTVVTYDKWKQWRPAEDASSFSIVFITAERLCKGATGQKGFPSFIFCAYPELLDRPQIEKNGQNNGPLLFVSTSSAAIATAANLPTRMCTRCAVD